MAEKKKTATKKEEKKEEKGKLRRTLQGDVVRISTTNTASVRVERKFAHQKYGKIIKSHKNYLVDLNGQEVEVGDAVTIGETKPISRSKSWEIIEKIK